MFKILIRNWRDDTTDPIRVLSGPIERPKVHFVTPAAELVNAVMQIFIHWINKRIIRILY